ncbi:MAG: hypothetical protein ACRD5R_14420 [Candidatus Acidiferrales bacterium]
MKNGEVQASLSRQFVFSALWIVILCIFFIASMARADSAAFDLVGPQLEMTVTRDGKTLPISSVSHFQQGDRLWIHTEFPSNQSVRYLLVVAFLQGPTNPPQASWFTRVETWTKHAREEGTVVTVPQDAQQALLFLAPETGGDFSTLSSTVRARPGVFVRASQDLNQASLDRTRVDTFVRAMQDSSNADPDDLHKRTLQLAKTLRLKIDQDCFDKPAEEQTACLTQNTEQMVLDDGHNQSLVAEITSGPSSDLIGAVSAMPGAGGGFYSPYVGSVMDLARLLSTLHTAAYQYIPALTLPQKDQLNLRLNAPPSFRNPKSVLVVGLPPVAPAQLPPLRPSNPKQIFCLQKSPLVLPVDGAPLVFSSGIAHDFALRLKGKDGTDIELPATADAASGGFVIDAHALKQDGLNAQVTGTLHGFWGFRAYDGPAFQLRSAQPDIWKIPAADSSALIVGREDTVHLTGGCIWCVKQVTALDEKGTTLKAAWKVEEPDKLQVQIPLKDEPAGDVTLQVNQYGVSKPDSVILHAYAEEARLDGFSFHAGDSEGVLTGTRLDEVEKAELNKMSFAPAKLSREKQQDHLELVAPSSAAIAKWQPGEKLALHAVLKDGRTLDLQTTVEPPRPKVALVSKSVQPGAAPFSVRLENNGELPQNGQLTFFVKSEVPGKFPRMEKIEVATADASFDFMLSVADSSLVRQDSESVLATFDPLKNFGPSAFGPLQFRAVDETGSTGDWQPLANLVRIPVLKDVLCPGAADRQCTLRGSNLFLLDSVAADPQFKDMVTVPAGYADATLSVPRPNGTLLYIKLRDDPATVDSVALPVLPIPDAQ